MNKVFQKTPAALITVSALLFATACADMTEPGGTDGGGIDGIVPLAFRGIPYQNASEETEEKLSEVTVFHFKGDDYLTRTDVADPYAESIGLPTDGTTGIYCVAGVDLTATNGVTKEADFSRSVIESETGAQSARLFYSGTASFDEESLRGGQVEVTMKRSVARIDLVNSIDAAVSISKVVVVDAPAATYVFAQNETAGDKTVTYTKEFATPFQGSETGIFTLFESKRPVQVRIIGEYGDSPLNTVAVLPSVERNKVYTLQIVNTESKAEGTFTVKDWEEGCSVGATPTGYGIFVDPVNSVIVGDVTVDYKNNTLSVPASGVKGMKLAFHTQSKIKIAMVEGQTSAVELSDNEPVKVDDGYVSSFNVNIAPQLNGAVGYKVILHLKDENGRYNFVEISVPDYHYIETVEMAGLTWMAFNAVSPDPDNQVFPFDGISVEEMYQQNWVQSIGNFFQYGRQKGYSPWEKNDPNGNEETPRNIPWTDPDCMPLPKGYHVASAAEWLQLLPSGTTIPSTYKAGNGENIKAELVALPGTISGTPSAAANRSNLQMRYIRFESLDTHNVLIFPICGQKTASWDEYPGSGQLIHNCVLYWISDDRCVWLLKVTDNNGTLTVTQDKNRYNYNGFMAVRGIKDKE